MRRAFVIDVGLVVVLAGASLLLGGNDLLHGSISRKAPGAPAVQTPQGMVLLWWGFGVLCALGILLWRRWPLAAVGVAAVGSAGHQLASSFPLAPLDLAAPIALYALAVRARSPWHSRLVTAGLVLVAYAVETVRELVPNGFWLFPSDGITAVRDESAWVAMSLAIEHTVFGAGLVLVLAYAFGEAARLRRAHVAMLEQRAADLERERDQRSTLAIAAERARITRELHDVVAHGLSVMVIQAQGAGAALRNHPDRAARALDEVIATGRSSLAEMRRLLGVVRRAPGKDPELAPQPGVAALPTLIDQVRAAGTQVDFTVDGEPAPLPSGVDLSSYRIIQEALTNVLKHAGTGARATVRIAFTPDQVEIEVGDDGAGPPSQVTDGSTETGHGLRGIAERVGILNGDLSTGARREGGYVLRARLPLGDDPPSAPPAPAAVPAVPR